LHDHILTDGGGQDPAGVGEKPYFVIDVLASSAILCAVDRGLMGIVRDLWKIRRDKYPQGEEASRNEARHAQQTVNIVHTKCKYRGQSLLRRSLQN